MNKIKFKYFTTFVHSNFAEKKRKRIVRFENETIRIISTTEAHGK
jgi:hypothetical protein